MNKNLIQEIGNLEMLHSFHPADDSAVSAAEEALGLRFAEDYRACLRSFGTVLAKGIALTGLGGPGRLNVVTVTREQRSLRGDFPKDLYVLEDIGVDGVLFLQSEDGTVYGLRPGGKAQRVAGSLLEYLRQAQA